MSLRDGDSPPPADLGPRVFATAIDTVLQVLLLIPVVMTLLVVSMASVDVGPGLLGPPTLLSLLVSLVVAPFVLVGYHAWLEGRYAETFGKRLVGLRVVDATKGTPVDWYAALLRNVFRLVDVLPGAYLLGGLVSWIDEDNRRLGDFVAQTRVVYHLDD
jgi:uncharacterized RDD family membrane protein YckC